MVGTYSYIEHTHLYTIDSWLDMKDSLQEINKDKINVTLESGARISSIQKLDPKDTILKWTS